LSSQGELLDGVYLFVSVDMVNSTDFKAREGRWPLVLHHFYESVHHEMKKVCPRFRIWKHIGDEVAFYRLTTSEDQLAELIQKTYHALQSIGRTLDNIQTDHHIKTRHVVGAKATMWVAFARYVGKAEDDPVSGDPDDNRIILIEEEEPDGQQIIKAHDFIGPDIDIGFRIAHFAHRGFVALSAGLTHLVLEQEKKPSLSELERHMERHMKIVKYEVMKGVWGGRRYPIIWYTDDWTNVREKFHYDEEWEDPIVADVCNKRYFRCERVAHALWQTNRWDMVVRACKRLGLEVEDPPKLPAMSSE
jgi:hypothetical protein